MTIRATAAVVLARGIGSRMRRPTTGAVLDPRQAAAAAEGLKGMIPDAVGRPFLDHVLSALADGGVEEVCFVVAPEHDGIREHYTAHPPTRLRLAWAIQAEARGTADAVLAAASWINGRDVLVLNADNLYPAEAVRALVELGGAGMVACDADALVVHGNIERTRIAAFALVDMDPRGMLRAILEKPSAETFALMGPNPRVSMNLWRLDARLVDACRQVPLSPRGEYELPQAVALAIEAGHEVIAVPMAVGVLDLSQQDDVAAVAAILATRPCQP